MKGYLLKLKERWENCKDPEKEIGQKLWRLYSQHVLLNSIAAAFLFFLCTSQLAHYGEKDVFLRAMFPNLSLLFLQIKRMYCLRATRLVYGVGRNVIW
jgi:hypothetical protein